MMNAASCVLKSSGPNSLTNDDMRIDEFTHADA